MNRTTKRHSKLNRVARLSAVLIPGVFAVLAVTVQWGVVITKLDHVEIRLDELLIEARALRTEYQNIERRVSYIERRVSYIEGRISGGGAFGGGRDTP